MGLSLDDFYTQFDAFMRQSDDEVMRIFIICDDLNGSRRAEPFFDDTPQKRTDGIAVGELGRDDGDRKAVLKFAQELAKESTAPRACSFGAAAKQGNLCHGNGEEF